MFTAGAAPWATLWTRCTRWTCTSICCPAWTTDPPRWATASSWPAWPGPGHGTVVATPHVRSDFFTDVPSLPEPGGRGPAGAGAEDAPRAALRRRAEPRDGGPAEPIGARDDRPGTPRRPLAARRDALRGRGRGLSHRHRRAPRPRLWRGGGPPRAKRRRRHRRPSGLRRELQMARWRRSTRSRSMAATALRPSVPACALAEGLAGDIGSDAHGPTRPPTGPRPPSCVGAAPAPVATALTESGPRALLHRGSERRVRSPPRRRTRLLTFWLNRNRARRRPGGVHCAPPTGRAGVHRPRGRRRGRHRARATFWNDLFGAASHGRITRPRLRPSARARRQRDPPAPGLQLEGGGPGAQAGAGHGLQLAHRLGRGGHLPRQRRRLDAGVELRGHPGRRVGDPLPADGPIADAYRILHGTAQNCSGGPRRGARGSRARRCRTASSGSATPAAGARP